MDWGSCRPCMPFLSAAIAALALYRVLETDLGFTSTTIFAFGLYGAALIAVPLGFDLLIKPRGEINSPHCTLRGALPVDDPRDPCGC
jgi:hypothetical protein